MRHPLRWTLALLAGLALLSPLSTLQAQEKENQPEKNPLVGKKAPDIKGEFALNGKPVALSDLKGKVVLLDFWAVWCGPCIRTFPHLKEWQKEFGDEGLVILGVTTYYKRFDFDTDGGKLIKAAGVKQEKDENTGKIKILGGLSEDQEHVMLKKFVKHYELKHRIMPVSQDMWKQASKDYNVRGIPTAVLIDRQGVIRMVKIGSGDANAKALEAEIRKLLKEQ